VSPTFAGDTYLIDASSRKFTGKRKSRKNDPLALAASIAQRAGSVERQAVVITADRITDLHIEVNGPGCR
jgi:hypothetical protein